PEVTVVARGVGVSTRRPRRNLAIIEARLTDGPSTLTAVWFNQAFRERQLAPGAEVALSGVVESFRGRLQMKSPAVDLLSSSAESLVTGRVVPVHQSVGEMSPGHLRRAVHEALKIARPISDPLPEELVERLGMVSRDRAIAEIHFPEQEAEVGPARERLVFDELFRLEVALALQKRRRAVEEVGIAHPATGELVDQFVAGLPFVLTDAQRRVIGELRDDLASDQPMHRLLQGEVGSGKTVLAAVALLYGIEGGYQGAVMAPTEVLAEQHYRGMRGLLEEAGLAPAAEGDGARLGMGSLFGDGDGAPDRPVSIGLITSSTAEVNFRPPGGASRQEVMGWVADGRIDLVVGTHALIQEGAHFARLGVAVVDEQHRFGVGQRVKLKEKAADVGPDLLIMTATPIPRTLSMTLYGDLDVSLLDEMPPGRVPVETVAIGRGELERAYDLIRREVVAGRQAFVVCPLVADSPKVEAASATAEYQRLQGVFPDLRLGLLHGQLGSREKEGVMSGFRDGALDVLVCTTVIEVGIDVPNATVMMIEDAERFGLSQLHQLRGRVGRGGHRGVCVLVADPGTDEGLARIEAMMSSTDGFHLAEQDLRIRGQGTVFGTRQSGMADLRLADILEDVDTLVAARREAFAMVEADPALDGHPGIREEVRAMLGERVEWLFIS
ncbi:MAG: ATP-dependent DNA helicase RecG, partial [Acidimicrobiia bacterium]